jgi:hypothetical protein
MTRKPKTGSGQFDPEKKKVLYFHETCENHASFVWSFRVNLTRAMSDFGAVLCSRVGTKGSETQLTLFLTTSCI